MTSSPLLSEDTPDFNFFFGNGSLNNNNTATYNSSSSNINSFQRSFFTRSLNDYNLDDQFKYFKQRKPDNIEIKEILSKERKNNGISNQVWVFKTIKRLRRAILSGNAYINRSNAEFFDEFVYNIIYSKLLEERLMISNYKDVQFACPNSDVVHFKDTKRTGVHKFEKYNIQRQSNDCFSIRLFSSTDARYVKNLVLMIGMIKEFRESLEVTNRDILVLKLIALLVDIKNHIINRTIYSRLLLKDCLSIFKLQFLKLNIALDLIYKRIILKFKEIEIHNDPIRKLNPCLIDKKKIIQYISENIKLQTNNMILNIRKLLNFLLRYSNGQKDPASTISFHIMNYSRTNKIDLNKVSNAIYDFYYDSVIRNSTTLDIINNELMTLKLRTMKLPLKTGSANSPFSSPKLRFKFMGNIDDTDLPETNNTDGNEDLQYTYALLDGYLNELHLIRKFYLVMWIIVLALKISNKNFEYDSFDMDDVKVQKDPDFIRAFNIIQIINMMNMQHENLRDNSNIDKPYYDSKIMIFNQLRDMLLNDCKLATILNDQIHAYLRTNNLLTMLEVKTYKNKLNAQKNEVNASKIENEDVALTNAKQDLIQSLNFISYSIARTQELSNLGNALTSIADLASNNRLSKYIDNINNTQKIPLKAKTQVLNKNKNFDSQFTNEEEINPSFNNDALSYLISSSPYMLTDQTKRPVDSKPLSVITRDLDYFYSDFLDTEFSKVVRSPRKSSSPSVNIGSPSFKSGLQLSVLKVNSEIAKDDYNDNKKLKEQVGMHIVPASEGFTTYSKIGDFSENEREPMIRISRKDFEKELNSRIELALGNIDSNSMPQ